jgi:hypothetical protein
LESHGQEIIFSAILLVFLIGAWIYSEKKGAEAVRPPAGGTNLVAFLEARPKFIQIRKFVHDGKVYLEVAGQAKPSSLSLPSGPPACIFDETGAMVGWSGDLGDDSSFEKK